MKKESALFLAVVAAAFHAAPVLAADVTAQATPGPLMASGILETAYGLTSVTNISGDVTPDQEEYFSSRSAGRFSMPLNDTLSLQADIDFEYGRTASSDVSSDDNLEDSLQFGAHLSNRDLQSGLTGLFAGGGRNHSDTDIGTEFWFAGAEAQLFSEGFTPYLQVGWLDGQNARENTDANLFRDALFVRAVGRMYPTADTRLQLEAAYARGVADADEDKTDIIEWGARLDLPQVGPLPLFVSYRGTSFENPDSSAGGTDRFVEHVFMAGLSFQLGTTSRLETDRAGAGLDLPGLGRWVASGEVLD